MEAAAAGVWRGRCPPPPAAGGRAEGRPDDKGLPVAPGVVGGGQSGRDGSVHIRPGLPPKIGLKWFPLRQKLERNNVSMTVPRTQSRYHQWTRHSGLVWNTDRVSDPAHRPTLQKARGKPSLRLPAPHPPARRAGVRTAGGTVIVAPSIGGVLGLLPSQGTGSCGARLLLLGKNILCGGSVELPCWAPGQPRELEQNSRRASRADGAPGTGEDSVPRRAIRHVRGLLALPAHGPGVPAAGQRGHE